MPVSPSTSARSRLLDVVLPPVAEAADCDESHPITHLELLPARAGQTLPWPRWADPGIVAAFGRRGIVQPFVHQVEAADLAHRGRHVVIATGTASGKSLAYQLPALSGLTADPRATVLYIAPTKALAADQLSSLVGLGVPGVYPSLFDGDTPVDVRDWVRAHSRWVLTNPDMLHRGILPQHARWIRFLRRLRYVVIDECHAYRGVFGSHVALVLRRLLRIAARYGAQPTVVLASATVADPAVAGQRLIGAPVVAVTEDCSPRPGVDFVLWEPGVLPDAVGEHGAPVRRSAPAETARLLADLVAAGARVLAFVRSRHGAEQTAMSAQRRLGLIAPQLVERVSAYRGGYLPEERRELERALNSGELLGVATTNALELGVDIAGLDAAILAGFPGTLASMWQQAGRAGRGTQPALVVFVARADPLDSYLVHHPEAVFGRSIEAAITNPTNPYLLRPHLACAAAEHHLSVDDLDAFGGPAARACIDDLLADGVLKSRPAGWFFAGLLHPSDEVDLRGGGGGQIVIVENGTARMLGTVDSGRAAGSVFPGAVYLHRGISYVVDSLDLDEQLALVHQEAPDYTTMARSTSSVDLLEVEHQRELRNGIRCGFSRVRVTEQVVGFIRRRLSGQLIDQTPLDMPEHCLDTRAVWYTVPVEVLALAGVPEPMIPGALHAAEHAAIGLLPLFAGCDRWDIGGLSTNLHPDTGEPAVIVYDGYPGGAGFAERGYQLLGDWLTAVGDAVASCPCQAGCPSCVQSPKCGNGNEPLNKAAAVVVLRLMSAALGGP